MPLFEIASEGSVPPELPGISTGAWNPGVAGDAITCAPTGTSAEKMDRAKRIGKRRFSIPFPPDLWHEAFGRRAFRRFTCVCPQDLWSKRRLLGRRPTMSSDESIPRRRRGRSAAAARHSYAGGGPSSTYLPRRCVQ